MWRLAEKFDTAVLLKGGHLDGAECLDLLIDAGEVHRFSAARIPVAGSHGAGCTLSAAIAVGLARSDSLPDLVKTSKNDLGRTLFHSESFTIEGSEITHALDQGPTWQNCNLGTFTETLK